MKYWHPFSAYAEHPPIGCDICAILTRVWFGFGVVAGSFAGAACTLIVARLAA